MKKNTREGLKQRKNMKSSHSLLPWEEKTLQAVGNVVEFWGFKENHGRIWALLSLRKEGLTALEIRKLLGLSKGAVSMLLQDLETWTIVLRDEDQVNKGHSQNKSPENKRRGRVYKACSDLFQMISYVLKQREQDLLENTLFLLKNAHQEAQDVASSEQINTLSTMLSSAVFVQEMLSMFCDNPSFAHSLVKNIPRVTDLNIIQSNEK